MQRDAVITIGATLGIICHRARHDIGGPAGSFLPLLLFVVELFASIRWVCNV